MAVSHSTMVKNWEQLKYPANEWLKYTHIMTISCSH